MKRHAISFSGQARHLRSSENTAAIHVLAILGVAGIAPVGMSTVKHPGD